jgi:hypothetical protein
MSLRWIAVGVVGLALAPGASSFAQGLGDVASRERAKRAEAAKKAEPARQFTNEDLDAGRPAGTEATPAGETPQAGGDEGREAERPDTALPSERLRPELDAVSSARSRVSGLEARIRDLGDKLNPMSGSFIFGPTGSNDANEEAAVRAEMSQAETELGQARGDLAAATAALEEASRRQNLRVPEAEPEPH